MARPERPGNPRAFLFADNSLSLAAALDLVRKSSFVRRVHATRTRSRAPCVHRDRAHRVDPVPRPQSASAVWPHPVL
ncbi:hypothetical protein [Lysobacter gummosus]|uniref:hypothetical protein n=1 Tax=Lysobacter gummosus TaxID=262324 RepID=UPI00362EDA3D